MRYFFHLGHSPALALREISQVLSVTGVKFEKHSVNPHQIIISTKTPLNVTELGNQLGGTIRIASQVSTATSLNLVDSLAHQFSSTSHKATFALASLSPELEPKTLSVALKKVLKEKSISSRFILPDYPFTTPLKLLSQNAQEFIILPDQGRLLIFATQFVTDVIAWQKRDRARPAFDPSSGMLPPKIARILLNLTLDKPLAKSPLIFDPFCGSGTIMAEALTLGLPVIGSDISPEAVKDTSANLKWLTANTSASGTWAVSVADARRVKPDDLGVRHVDAIVTETYLGPPSLPPRSQLPKLIDSLAPLYQESLLNLANFLRPGGRLTIALPDFGLESSVKMADSLIDTCEKRGYTRVTGPHIYAKPKALVRRAIITFSYK